MKFLMMTTNDPSKLMTPPTPEMYAEMGKLIEHMTREGAMIATGGLDPKNAIHIQSSGGKVTVTDGPFTEAKEAIVGFALIEAKSKEEAIEYSKRFWKVAGDGQGMVYQVFGP